MRLRPHSHLFRQGMLASLAFMTPVFVVLYVITVPDGPWVAVLVTQVFVSLAVAFASAAYFWTAIWVSAEGISERGFFGRTVHVPVAEIQSVYCAETFDGSSENPVPQLFIRGTNGRSVVRMRGQFWSRASMDTVVAELGLPHQFVEDTVTVGELRERHPYLLYWFERRPVIAAIVFSIASGLVGLGIYLLFHLVGG